MVDISVIVPVYNVEELLPRCVESIMAQTKENIEIILVDDGATDGSGAVCDDYAKKDERIRVIHKPNGGLTSAWKAGAQAAKGAYLGFIDSDDWIHTKYLEALYNAIITYVKKGGFAIQCNIFNMDDLKKAQEKPLDYKNLQVRVCGWNAYFVDLSKEEQEAFIKQLETAAC